MRNDVTYEAAEEVDGIVVMSRRMGTTRTRPGWAGTTPT